MDGDSTIHGRKPITELEILLARAQALALKANRQIDEAELYLRRAIELGSQRGEECNILDLRLSQDDYVGVRQRLVEFRDRLTPEKVRLYKTVSLALEGQVTEETPICWEELPDPELFGRAVLANALGHDDATQRLEEALAAKPGDWKQRKLEALLLQRQGASVCSLCQQEPAVRLWDGKRPLCVSCAERLDDPTTLMQVFTGEQSPEKHQLAAWLGGMAEPEELKELQELFNGFPPGSWVDGNYQLEMPDGPSNRALLQILSDEQLLAALPPAFHDRLVRPLSLGLLAQAVMNEPSAEVKQWLTEDQLSSVIQEAETWPAGESSAFWALQTAQWSSMLDSRAPGGVIDLAALWETIQLQAPEHSGLHRNCSGICGAVCRSVEGLAAEELALVESLLTDRPSDLFLRCLLMGAYPFGHPRKQEQELWFVRNRPRLGSIGPPHHSGSWNSEFEAAAVIAWAEHILKNLSDTTILGPAAEFFRCDNSELAIALYSRCLELEPTKSEWYRELARAIEKSSPKREAKAKALQLMEQSLELEEEECYQQMLRTNMVGLAVEAGEDEKARTWALELVEQAHSFDFTGDALHQGHLALGFLALKAGHIAEAESHLVRAGQVPTSPVLGSFGPSMLLARHLLQQGSSQAVLAYLEECKTFWDSGSGDLQKWIEAIKRGDTPDFGSNLNY